MSVSPSDFELYSRVTGAPMPRSPQEQMQMAPQVHNFIRSQGYAQKPSFYRGVIRPAVQTAMLAGGAIALANALGGNNDDDPPNNGGGGGGSGPLSSNRDLIDVSHTQIGDGPAQLPPGVRGGDIVATSQNPSPQMPSPGDNVGSVGTIVRDLNTGAVPTNIEDVPSKGFDYTPGYMRQESSNLYNMKPWNIPDANANDPISFAGKLGASGIGSLFQNLPTIAEQGSYDLKKGGDDLATGARHIKTTIDGVYQWGKDARSYLDSQDTSYIGAATNNWGVPVGDAHQTQRHPDLPPGEQSHNRNRSIHSDSNRYPNDEPGAWVTGVEDSISGAGLSARANAQSGLGREGVPVGAIPSLRMSDIRTTDESASLSPQGDLIATNLQGVPDPVNALWYGGQKPTQNVLNEATADLRRKYADVYESQGITGSTLPDDERISGWQGQGGGSEGLAGTASGVINYEPAPGYRQQSPVQTVVAPVPQRDLVQDAREHFGNLGGISIAPKDSTSVRHFSVSPAMMVDTDFVKTPEKRYTKDLATGDYVVEPSAIPEINPATLAAIEQDVRREAVDSGLSVLQGISDVARTGKGAGRLAGQITRSPEFKNKPGYYTYRTDVDPWL